jgi:CDP-diacylglycerol pyrophosphatase
LAAALTSSAQGARQNPLSRILRQTEDAHPNALWHVVHGLCVRDMKASGNPAPCAEVNLAAGYAVLKDLSRKTQYLLVPTDRITGIESPALLAPDAPNYWRAAWSARRFIEQRAGRPLPREDIGLAVNSVPGRTQNQLHIHIDCVKLGVILTLRSNAARLGAHWTPLDLWGRTYRARWIADPDLSATDPFKLLARSSARARADMGRETIVLVGATRAGAKPGFIMLADRAEGDDTAAGEELLDHHCQILSQPAPG